MIIITYLLMILSSKTSGKYRVYGNCINIVCDVEIHRVTTTSGSKIVTIDIKEESLQQFVDKGGNNQCAHLLGEFCKDLLTVPFIYSIPFKPIGHETIIEFRDKRDNVMFFTTVSSEGLMNRKFISLFIKGPYEHSKSLAKMEFSLSHIILNKSPKNYYFVVSGNVADKVKLDKSIEACEWLMFVNNVISLINELYKEIYMVYQSIEAFKDIDKRSEEKKRILNCCVLSIFGIFEGYRRKIKATFDTRLYEDYTMKVYNPDFSHQFICENGITDVFERLNEIVNDKLKPLLDKLIDKRYKRSILGVYPSFRWKSKTIKIINDLKAAKDAFLKLFEQKCEFDKSHIVQRNKEIRKTQQHSEEDLQVENMKQIGYLLDECITLSLINYEEYFLTSQPILTIKEDVSNSQNMFEFHSMLEKSNYEILNEIEGYIRLEIKLEIFKRDPSSKTVSYLILDEAFCRLTFRKLAENIKNLKERLIKKMKDLGDGGHQIEEVRRHKKEIIRCANAFLRLKLWSEVKENGWDVPLSDYISKPRKHSI